MRGGYDIVSEIPVSQKLYYQLVTHLIPQFFEASPDVYHTKIICDVVCPEYHPKEIAMAMSCGLDSFTSFYKSLENDKLSAYKVSLLTFFENGAHHMGTIGHDEREPIVFEEQLSHVKRYCEEIGFPLLAVRSNLDEVLSDLFWRDSYQSTHSFRNAGFVLLFQKLIKVYFYGAAYTAAKFNASIRNGDTAKFDIFLFPNVSTASTDIYVTESMMTRVEKIKYLNEYSQVRDFLLVCYKGGTNCGNCSKCRRTLVELDFAGVLDNFHKSFDVQNYKKNRRKYVLRVFIKKNKDLMSKELYEYSIREKIKIPAIWYVIGGIGAICYDIFLFLKKGFKKSK